MTRKTAPVRMEEMVPFSMRSSEPGFATQIVPSLLARMPTAASLPKPSKAENVVTAGSRKLSIPFVVAAHTMPSLSSKRAHTVSLDKPSVRP